MANVLVLGSGAREHAIACKLIESQDVSHVYVCSGNQGMVNVGTGSPSCITVVSDLDVHNHQHVCDWCHTNEVSLAIIGPEDLLDEGLSDSLNKSGIRCFGPSAEAARIESSKEFSKQFMTQFNIPTARWESFTDCKQACDYIRRADYPALVVKASGLAAGKGVIVAKDKEEACQAAVDILQGRFGEAGSTIVVEEMLEGEEVSCLAFCDGKTVVLMPPAQDHKRLLDGDRGPNTGGMGAYCPCPLITDLEQVKTNILQKTVDCMRQLNCPFIGVLYAGLMLTKNGPKVLEFNCRFGDPETQVILPLLRTDLYRILNSCVLGQLSSTDVQFHQDRFAVGVVMASGGYPEGFQKGYAITGIRDAVKQFDASVFCAGVSRGESGQLVTSGGRVLTVVATNSTLASAASKAQAAANLIKFTGRTYRSDIAHKALRFWSSAGLTYRDAGVDIEAGESLVQRIRPLAKSTSRPGCTPDLGLFGGIFDLKPLGFVDPLLVTGTDGVGTKLQIAHAVGNFDTVGIDLVAMSVNDVLCHAAEPLFFLDCFSCSKLDVSVAGATIAGITEGCLQANCALVGGETAEMPGTYISDHFEVSGFVVGAVERFQYLPRSSEIVPSDVVIGIPSTGVHSNGFSLVRALVSHCHMTYDLPCPFDSGKSLGESLLTPTKIYVRGALGALRSGLVKAAAHITGGGLPGNIPRVLPDPVGVQLDAMSWNMPPVFGWISNAGKVDIGEMSRTFNCGIGFVVITSSEHQSAVLQRLHADGEVDARVIGSVVPIDKTAQNRVNISNLEEALVRSFQPDLARAIAISNGECRAAFRKQRVAVLISGSGTNLQALIDDTQSRSNDASAEIVLVISNVADVTGLKRAEKAGIPTKVINHKTYGSREQFDAAIHEELVNSQIDIVCLAGFMRIVSAWFVQKWRGKLINIHPSLLPAFKGSHAHRLVLEAGVRVTGCTVHFVVEDVDAGAIIAQESVPVDVKDTEETLSERVKLAEHKIFPQALELLASGAVKLSENGKAVWR